MTEEDFFEYMSRLWSMVMWGNKRFVVDKLISDNGFDMLKKQLAELLYGTAQIEKRWNAFLKSVKGGAVNDQRATYLYQSERVHTFQQDNDPVLFLPRCAGHAQV